MNQEDTAPLKIEHNAKPKRRIFLKIVIGLGIVLLGVLIGSGLGYYKGINDRMTQQTSQVTLAATTQFQLALADQAAGKLETARSRMEYVIQLDPGYPGAVEKLTEIMMASSIIATPTAIPSPMATGTPDTRGEEDLFAQARQYLANGEWVAATDTLDSLRKVNRNFRAIEVDGMYYVGLRYRGMDKILNGNLEEGIYDFTLTERFGPLDKDANSYRNWCRYYINGASFWGLDWAQVVEAFAQIYPSVPNLRDGSGWTATDRFRLGSINYGDQLAAKEAYCDAEYQYASALKISEDQLLAPTATAVYDLCNPPATSTPEPEIVVPTAAPAGPTATPETPIPASSATPEPTVCTVDCTPVVPPVGP